MDAKSRKKAGGKSGQAKAAEPMKKTGRGGYRPGAGRKEGIEIKPPEAKRRNIVQIKFTDSERERLDALRGKRTISAYIRTALGFE